MGFCSCINKTFLIILNFLVLAVGIAVIALASIVIHRSKEYGELLMAGVLTLPIWILLVGIVVTLIGFFGCCGAIKENKCMLYTYATIVMGLFIAELVLGILIAVYPRQAADTVKKVMSDRFRKYGGDDEALTRAIDSIQHDTKCCGVNNFDDWITYNKRVPTSCCKDMSACDTSRSTDIFNRGCFDAIVDSLKGVTIALAITAIVLALIQVVCIGIACGLAKKKSEYV